MKTTSKKLILSKTENNDILAFLNHFDDVKWQQGFLSVKLMNKQINHNRLVIGMRASDIPFKKLARKLLELKFPENKLIELENRYYKAHDIGFAIEINDGEIDLRTYFEIKYTNSIWYNVKSERIKKQDYHTMPLFVGYKWGIKNQKTRVSHYNYIQYMDGDNLIKRINQIADYIPDCIVRQLKGKTEEQVRNYVVMEVKDDTTDRASYDIRFDANKIYLKDFSSKEIMERFKINFEALEKYKNLSIGHISGGKDKNGEDFLTLYFVV